MKVRVTVRVRVTATAGHPRVHDLQNRGELGEVKSPRAVAVIPALGRAVLGSYLGSG